MQGSESAKSALDSEASISILGSTARMNYLRFWLQLIDDMWVIRLCVTVPVGLALLILYFPIPLLRFVAYCSYCYLSIASTLVRSATTPEALRGAYATVGNGVVFLIAVIASYGFIVWLCFHWEEVCKPNEHYNEGWLVLWDMAELLHALPGMCR